MMIVKNVFRSITIMIYLTCGYESEQSPNLNIEILLSHTIQAIQMLLDSVTNNIRGMFENFKTSDVFL